MARYCDSARLEGYWFSWVMASRAPQLEHLRRLGLLWSKPLEYVSDGPQKLPNPQSKTWQHCVAVGQPFWLQSEGDDLLHDPDKPENEYGLLPEPSLLTLESDHPVHRLSDPFSVSGCLIPALKADGYQLERPVDECWEALINDIRKICEGVSRKFNQSEDDRCELAQETIMQIIRKLRGGKLTYMPGKAPVFNLLTTTAHRIMFSVLNRNNKQRRNTAKLASDLKAGVLPQSMRSLRVPCRSCKV